MRRLLDYYSCLPISPAHSWLKNPTRQRLQFVAAERNLARPAVRNGFAAGKGGFVTRQYGPIGMMPMRKAEAYIARQLTPA